MISSAIISIFLFIPLSLLDLITPPTLNFELSEEVFITLRGLCRGAFYVMPVAGLMPIFYTRIGLAIMKVMIAFVVRVKSFIPTLGA